VKELAQVLQAVEDGDAQSAEALLPLVYEELRQLAARKLAQQPPGQTLQATALVHEAYLKLRGNERARWTGEKHFFCAAAEAMRHILIDRARRRLRIRHGQNAERVELDLIELSQPVKEEVLLRMDEALVELKQHWPERAEIVNLRFFGGLSEPEIARLLQLSERSVQRHWSYAKAWLYERVEELSGKRSQSP
jgi:RNA polymerase sigma factor (TIGR02999 family)